MNLYDEYTRLLQKTCVARRQVYSSKAVKGLNSFSDQEQSPNKDFSSILVQFFKYINESFKEFIPFSIIMIVIIRYKVVFTFFCSYTFHLFPNFFIIASYWQFAIIPAFQYLWVFFSFIFLNNCINTFSKHFFFNCTN